MLAEQKALIKVAPHFAVNRTRRLHSNLARDSKDEISMRGFEVQMISLNDSSSILA